MRKFNKKELETLRHIKELFIEKEETLKEFAAWRHDNLLVVLDQPPNPGPNPKQAAILEAFKNPQYKTFGYSSGNRSGKTTIATILALSVIRGEYMWNKQSLAHLFPHRNPRKVRYIGQGWHDHIKAVVIPELEKWWPKSCKVEKHGNGIITDTYWRDVETMSTIELMSNNQNPKEHEGWSGDLLVYDEPPRREIYIANARGLVDRRGREVFAVTLLNEPWIDREIVKKQDEFGNPDRNVFWVQGNTYDNVGYGITEEGIEEFKKKLTAEEIQARIYGVPVYLQGLVYPEFNRKEHLVRHFKVPLDWMVDIAIDVHPRERQASLFLATDPRGDRYVCDEIWDYGDGTQVAEAIVRKVKQNVYRVNRCAIDPLAKGDKNNPETTYQKIFNVLARYDLPLETATKDRDAGILSVKQHLKGPNGKASLFLMDNCQRFLYEIEGYMWDSKTGKPRDEDDHMCENLYRLCLLNTRYYEPEEEEINYAHSSFDTGRNKVTGY